MAEVAVKYSLIIEYPAKLDLADAKKWYRQARPSLEQDFNVRFEKTLEHINYNPEAYAIVERKLRRASINRFPYGVYYLFEPPMIRVVAVVHSSRHPRRLEARAH